MENIDLLERVLTTAMDENLRNDLLRHLFKSTGRKNSGIPILKDRKHKLDSDGICERMKSVAGGTGVSVARLLDISPQAFNNQKKRKIISGNSIIDFHLKTGASVDWLIGSWDGRTDYLGVTNFVEAATVTNIDHPPQKNLSLVEVYDQNSGNVELKWCLTKHQVCHDDDNILIPDDFGVLLSLIIRYRDEAGTPERVKIGGKRHFQVRRVLAYVLGDPKLIRHVDGRAKKLTAEHMSGHVDRPGKTEFRLYFAKDQCLRVFAMLAEQHGLSIIKPEFDKIAWDYLIGVGSMSPRDWVVNKFNESKKTLRPEADVTEEIMAELHIQPESFSHHDSIAGSFAI